MRSPTNSLKDERREVTFLKFLIIKFFTFFRAATIKSTTKGEGNMDIQKYTYALIVTLMLIPVSVFAKPEVSINTVAEKEVVEMVNGKQIKKRVPAKNADSGQTIIFTLNYKNKGNEKALNIKIDNPIPKDTTFVVGSGIGKNSKMLFSIDGGKTFESPVCSNTKLL